MLLAESKPAACCGPAFSGLPMLLVDGSISERFEQDRKAAKVDFIP